MRIPPSEADMAIRLAVSLVYGSLIGLERQWHHKNAGLKTNSLVAIGATAFTLVSEFAFGPSNNPAQVAAGVVTGVGFIGAGVIMRRAGNVQGINSAATLWAVASMGVAAGVGYLYLATFVLAATLSIQFALRWLAESIDKRSPSNWPPEEFILEVTFDQPCAAEIRKIWSSVATTYSARIFDYREDQESGERVRLRASFELPISSPTNLSAISQQFSAVKGVTRASLVRKAEEDTD